MSMAGIAGAVVRLGAFDDKINPVIKPVMESVKTEAILELQEYSAKAQWITFEFGGLFLR